jgi:RNA polymerase sigma-70 factor (ECF subfamily)
MAAERALRSLPRFEGRSALSTGTYGIAYRTVLDHDRWFRRWARRMTLSDTIEEKPSDWDGERATIELTRARRLHVALGRLPAAKRAVLVLHDLEGMELKEVAKVVGANERTVRSRLRDGRKKLAELLSEDPCSTRRQHHDSRSDAALGAGSGPPGKRQRLSTTKPTRPFVG